MSTTYSVETIKGARQKTADNTYSRFLPFGTDGEYIDMMSGLDLEKELKLGGDHLSSIEEYSNGTTKITEKYAKEEDTQNYYQVETTIEESSLGTRITSELYWITSSEKILRKRKIIIISEEDNITEIKEEIDT